LLNNAYISIEGVLVHNMNNINIRSYRRNGEQIYELDVFETDIYYDVPIIGQKTSGTCWAACIEMVLKHYNVRAMNDLYVDRVNSKYRARLDQDGITKRTCIRFKQYLDSYTCKEWEVTKKQLETEKEDLKNWPDFIKCSNKLEVCGLPPFISHDVFRWWGFEIMERACWMFKEFRSILRIYGPLIFAGCLSREGKDVEWHAVVITGAIINEDQPFLLINDPWIPMKDKHIFYVSPEMCLPPGSSFQKMWECPISSKNFPFIAYFKGH